VIFSAIYIDLAFYRIHAMRLGTDTGTFLQTLVNFWHTGSTYNFSEHRPKLSMHDSWTIVLSLAPIVGLIPHVETLLIAGVVVVAAASVPLYYLARSFQLSKGASAALATAFLVSPSAQGWAFNNFTELEFVPLLAFLLALAARRRSVIGVAIFAELLTGVKEDESLFLIWLGLASILWFDRRIGVTAIVVGAINWVGYRWLQHHFGYPPHIPSYQFSDPQFLTHLAFLAEVLAPFAFLPLWLGPAVLIGLPWYLEITFNKEWLGQSLAQAGHFYTVPLVTMIAVGAVAAAARRPQHVRFVIPCALIMFAFFNTTVLRIGRHEYPPDWSNYDAARAASLDGRYHRYTAEQEACFPVAASNLNVHYDFVGRPLNRPPWWSKSEPLVPIPPNLCEDR